MMLRVLTVTLASFALWLALGGAASAQTPSAHPSSTASFQVAGADIASRCMLAEVDSGSRNDFERASLDSLASTCGSSLASGALVDGGAYLKSRDEFGLTPLHYAVPRGLTSVIAALADAGANLEARTGHGWTPLHLAAQFSKSPSVVEALLDAGADPLAKTSNDGRLPWELATFYAAIMGTYAYSRLDRARIK